MWFLVSALWFLQDTVPAELVDCFSADTSVVMHRASREICVTLASAHNAACEVLPRGVLLEVVLERLSFTPALEIPDFEYGGDAAHCVACLDHACLFDRFWESVSAHVTVRSVSYFSTVTPGHIVQRQQDDENCFTPGNMQIRVERTSLNASVLLNPVCREHFAAPGLYFVNMSLQMNLSEARRNFMHVGNASVFSQTSYDGATLTFRYSSSTLGGLEMMERSPLDNGRLTVFFHRAGVLHMMVAETDVVIFAASPLFLPGAIMFTGEHAQVWADLSPAEEHREAQARLNSSIAGILAGGGRVSTYVLVRTLDDGVRTTLRSSASFAVRSGVFLFDLPPTWTRVNPLPALLVSMLVFVVGADERVEELVVVSVNRSQPVCWQGLSAQEVAGGLRLTYSYPLNVNLTAVCPEFDNVSVYVALVNQSRQNRTDNVAREQVSVRTRVRFDVTETLIPMSHAMRQGMDFTDVEYLGVEIRTRQQVFFHRADIVNMDRLGMDTGYYLRGVFLVGLAFIAVLIAIMVALQHALGSMCSRMRVRTQMRQQLTSLGNIDDDL